jgi:hypothetical protein
MVCANCIFVPLLALTLSICSLTIIPLTPRTRTQTRLTHLPLDQTRATQNQCLTAVDLVAEAQYRATAALLLGTLRPRGDVLLRPVLVERRYVRRLLISWCESSLLPNSCRVRPLAR